MKTTVLLQCPLLHLTAEEPAVTLVCRTRQGRIFVRVAYHIVDNGKNKISSGHISGRPGCCMAGQTNGSGHVSQEFLLRQVVESSGSHMPDIQT